jgi:hypothetical protein
MPFLAAGPDITPITDLITTWIHIGQALVGSVGALAFIFGELLCTSYWGGFRYEKRRAIPHANHGARLGGFLNW